MIDGLNELGSRACTPFLESWPEPPMSNNHERDLYPLFELWSREYVKALAKYLGRYRQGRPVNPLPVSWRIAQWSGVIELGAGAGILGEALQREGVKVWSVDSYEWPMARPWNVDKIPAEEIIAMYRQHTLPEIVFLACWPPRGIKWLDMVMQVPRARYIVISPRGGVCGNKKDWRGDHYRCKVIDLGQQISRVDVVTHHTGKPELSSAGYSTSRSVTTEWHSKDWEPVR